jgi:hypothetical protein
VFSFIHADDAATVIIAALDRPDVTEVISARSTGSAEMTAA